jgi:hypothetical protein
MRHLSVEGRVMSEKAILQAVHDQLMDAIERARPHVEKKVETLEKPIDWNSGYRLVSNGRSERPVFDGEGFNPKVIAFEYWPGLEPLYTLAKRVQGYIEASATR